MHLPTSRVSSVSRFSKKQSKFRQIESQKTATQVCWSVLDLPSEPEMGGKRMMEWFLSPHSGDDIISPSSKVVQGVLIHQPWGS